MLDGILTFYLGLHAVLAILIDGQAIAPASLLGVYEQLGLTAVVAKWVKDESDFLVGENPLWFQSLVLSEIFVQVPLCVYLAGKWAARSQDARMPSLLYSVHVLTTMVPIFSTLCADDRPTLVCKLVYAIWILLPLLLFWRSLSNPLFGKPKLAVQYSPRKRK